jgi:hypothetical protein
VKDHGDECGCKECRDKAETQRRLSRRARAEAFWKSEEGKALMARLHAERDNRGRFTKKEAA